jgi:hypothetical protein
MDETGNTGWKADPANPVHMIGCLVVDAQRVRAFESELAEIAGRHFPKVHRTRGFEFHGAELFGGKGYFKRVPVATRLQVTTEIIDVAIQHAATFGYAGVDKMRSYAGDHPHRISFLLLVERLEPYLQRVGELGLLIADENQEIAQVLIDDFALFKEISTNWGYKRVQIVNIVDSVHFVQSKNNRIIQACDVLTYFQRKADAIRAQVSEAFALLPLPRPSDFLAWRNAKLSKSERATVELGDRIARIPCFASKLFP